MKLSIQPLLPIGNFLNKRYGMEQDFPDDSNPMENFKYLNDVVTAIHMAEFPMFYKDGKPLFLPMANQTPAYNGEEMPPEIQVNKEKENPVSNMITAITTCTTIDTLKTFEKLAKSKPEFQTAYDKTMELLTNKTN
jgi:hypothetical protein